MPPLPLGADLMAGSPSAVFSPVTAPASAHVNPDHPIFQQMADARQAMEEEPARCGNCAHRVDRNGGTSFCQLQNFMVRPADPSCGLWDPLPEAYNEESAAFRVDIGGPNT